ncbi:hypothetical protein J4429_04840 [Candidatus Pacearchaeota archaeon]|nr:hypothetical protein [Candidatus Pacearchaeota archaeon]
MEYNNRPCLGNCNSYAGSSYGLHSYLTLKPVEYKNSIGDYSEKVDYSMQ